MKLTGLILLLLCSPTESMAQSGIRTDKVETIAGELQIVKTGDKKIEVSLGNKLVLTVNKKLSRTMNDLHEISIYKVVRHPIPPFDEVVILDNWLESFNCGPGVLFLGIKKNGIYRFSKRTPNCMNLGREIKVRKDRIEVTAEPYVHSTEQSYLEVPGGKWVYRKGQLRTIKYRVLRDPRSKRTPNNRVQRSAASRFLNVVSVLCAAPADAQCH